MAVYNSNITSANVSALKLLWQAETNSYVTAQPLYEQNRIYISDWQGYIYCYNAINGSKIYEKQLYEAPTANPVLAAIPVVNYFFGEPLPYMWNGFAGSGIIREGIWYLASVGGKKGGPLTNGAPGRLYAVLAKTGELLFDVELSSEIYSGSLAVPICDKKFIYAATCSVEEIVNVTNKLFFKSFTPDCTGEVFCFDRFSGKKIWSRKTTSLTPNDNAAKGASVWGGLELSQGNTSLYFATGNSYGAPASKASDSVIRVKSTDGSFEWLYQAVENDSWLPLKRDGPDFDFGCTPILFPCSKSSTGMAVGAGNKDAYLYALDEGTGKLLFKTYCHIKSKPDEGIRSNITYLSGRIYVWSKNKAPKDSISVNCINADNGSIIWNSIIDGTNNMTTGGVTNNLYFLSNYSGEIYALDIANGEKVWSNKMKKASFGSDIGIYQNRIYSGIGVPAFYGGSTKVKGVACFGAS